MIALIKKQSEAIKEIVSVAYGDSYPHQVNLGLSHPFRQLTASK